MFDTAELATKLADELVEVEGRSAAHDDEPVLRRSRLPRPADLCAARER